MNKEINLEALVNSDEINLDDLERQLESAPSRVTDPVSAIPEVEDANEETNEATTVGEIPEVEIDEEALLRELAISEAAGAVYAEVEDDSALNLERPEVVPGDASAALLRVNSGTAVTTSRAPRRSTKELKASEALLQVIVGTDPVKYSLQTDFEFDEEARDQLLERADTLAIKVKENFKQFFKWMYGGSKLTTYASLILDYLIDKGGSASLTEIKVMLSTKYQPGTVNAQATNIAAAMEALEIVSKGERQLKLNPNSRFVALRMSERGLTA